MPLPSIAQDIPLDLAGTLGGPTPAAAAPLTFFDKVKLGWKQGGAQADWGPNQHRYESAAYGDIRKALEERGHTLPSSLIGDDEADFYSAGDHPTKPWLQGIGAKKHFDAFWQAFAQERARDPNFAAAYKDVHDFSTLLGHVREQRTGTLSGVAAQAPDGLGLGGFVGQIASGFRDPVSYIPIVGPEARGLSFGSRLLYQGLKGAAINAGTTVAVEPLVQRDAGQMGQSRSAADFLTDLLASTATGGLIGAGAEFGKLLPSAVRAGSLAAAPRRYEADALGRALKHEIERTDIPAGSPLRSFDATVARVFGEVVPEDQRTPDEQSAIHAVNRDAEVKAGSPFVPGPEGDDQHGQWLEQAMHAIHQPEAAAARGPVRPVARESIAGPADVDGVRLPARELLKAKIHRAEAPHGGPNLAGGAALGPYQFMPQTWVSLFKRRYPGDPRDFKAIAALREDPHLNDVLINDLLSENAAALRHAGFEETSGNLYLAHVLGHDRAVTVLRAAPDAKLSALLPHGYFEKNPFRPTDSAGSLVKWAYGKMGEAGTPAHLASPEIATGAEAIGAGEGDPQVQPSTGRFDVEALYGDVGMADRPVLRPELFDSPEQHAAAQLRFERQRDAADGFAPVMSRAEAFSPHEHFDAVRGYAAKRGTVTADAIGEALGLSPGEVQRVVGAMQSVDHNSPYMLSRGRQPKLDKAGNVTRAGTEPGRVIRRPPRIVKANETMLEYVTRTGGGITDANGDLASMGAEQFHHAAPFRRKLIDNESGQSLDDAFQRAIDAGYFPEHMAGAETYADLPDPGDFLAAIDDELRGRPRHSIGEAVDAAEAARQARIAPEEEAALEERFNPRRMSDEERATHIDDADYEFLKRTAEQGGLDVGDDVLIDAYERTLAGQSLDEALSDAAMAGFARDLEEYAALTGETRYEPSHEFATFIGEHPEIRDDGGGGGEDGDGGGRSAPAESGAEVGRAELAQLAHDPAAREYDSPVGPAAEAQADSIIHDVEMEAGTAEPDGATYRLDEDGGESDLASILAEIEDAQKAATEMRNCLKPQGGGE